MPHLLPVNRRVVDEVDVGLERRLEAVLPALERGQDRDVVGRQRVLAGPEQVAELAQIDELHHLRFAHDELRAALDLLVVVRKAVRERVARVIGPLDDLDELAAEEIGQAHGGLLRLYQGHSDTNRELASEGSRDRCR